MQRRAVPCGSVLGPGQWPKMVETNDVAGASFGGTSKTFAGLALPGLASRAELLNRIKISWCIFTDCSSATSKDRKGKESVYYACYCPEKVAVGTIVAASSFGSCALNWLLSAAFYVNFH